MGRIRASLADVSTEFQPVEPGIYDLEIEKIEEVEKENEFVAYKVHNKIITPGDMQNKKIMEYIHLKQPGEEIAPDAIGLSTIKRYFEVTFGKDEVASWGDEDYDTDELVSKTFQAQVVIESYMDKKTGESRTNNKFKRMAPVD